MINGVTVAASPGPLGGSPAPGTEVSMVSFERNYDDPAELVIRVHGDWRDAPYPPDSSAVLMVDGVIVFEGLLYLPRPVLTTNEYPAVEYSIYDRSRALRGPAAVNAQGFPEINLPGGTLAAVAAAYFALAADELTARGVSASPAFASDAGAVACFPVSINGETIDQAVRQIAAAAPGVRVVMTPPSSIGGLSAYTFVRLMESPIADVTIDATRVQSLDIQPSVEGRCGAVKTLGGQTQGSADVEAEEDVALTPAWNPALESNWSLREAYEKKENGTPADPDLYIVFRAYTWEEDDIDEARIRRAMIRIVDDPNPLDALWQERSIESVDVENKTVILKRPAIPPYHVRNKLSALNPNHKGRSVAVPAKLRVAQSGTATTPIYITSFRVPEDGFAGRAYQMMPITCGYEETIAVPAGVDREQYARDAFAALSEPVISGSVPLDEGLPSDVWRLDRRINLRTDSHGATGYEDLRAPLLGVSQQWAAGETATLQFNRDDSVALAEGAQ